ncbi:hypothetical protein [Pelomonas sp. KK5]|uniref:hypothetical protein n=1 Tax=Pelomonas sp. KK5 TaxID=1855730 RepID=UPI00117FA8A4|nr:hypothetical protein [Pelomonas sp. KK5]
MENINHDESVVFDIAAILGASKSLSYKAQVEAQFAALLQFYVENELISVACFDECGRLDKNLLIRVRDLTSGGVWLASKFVPGWFRARDRDNNYSNVGILKNGLNEWKSKSLTPPSA